MIIDLKQNNKQPPPLRTFTRRMGNKSKHLKHILPLFPKTFDRYVEPFLGTGAVFLAVQPKKFIINDLNQDVMDTWKTVRHVSPSVILECFETFGRHFQPLSLSDKLEVCQKMVADLNRVEKKELEWTVLDKTIIYVLLTFCAYMGVVRMKNQYAIKGLEYNIYQHERYSFLTPEYASNLKRVHEYLSKKPKCWIQNTDYQRILRQCKKGDFVFLDPPYIENHTYQFEYNGGEKKRLQPSFLQELKEELRKLDEKGVQWMMTQAMTPEIQNLFNTKKYHVSTFQVYRIGTRGYATECIIRNYF